MAAVAMLSMNACNQDEEVLNNPEQKGEPVEFEMGISASTRTTTDNSSRVTTWVEGDAVGIFAYAKGTTTSPVATNAKYVLTGDKWVPAAGSEIYPEAAYDYYAYYPYQEGVTDPANISLAALADQTSAENYAKSDILAAPKTEAEANATTVPLTFKHVYAMVEVQVSGDKVTKQPTSVILKGVKLGGTLNLTATTPTVTLAGDATDVTMLYLTKTENPDAAPFSFRAVVPAQEIAASTPLVTINDVDEAGTDYSMQYSAAVTYEAGNYRQIKVNIGTAKVSLEIPKADLKIDPWGESDAISGEGEEVVVPFSTMTIPFDASTDPVDLGNYSVDKVTETTVTDNTWFKREAEGNTTASVGTTLTFTDENITIARGNLTAESGATNGWNNSSFGYRIVGNFETNKVYSLSFTVNNPGSSQAAIGALIRTSDDLNAFAITNGSGVRLGKTIQTSTIAAKQTNTYTAYIDFSKKSTSASSSNNAIAESGFTDTTASDIESVNIYLYNNTNNSSLVVSNIVLSVTDLTAAPVVEEETTE